MAVLFGDHTYSPIDYRSVFSIRPIQNVSEYLGGRDRLPDLMEWWLILRGPARFHSRASSTRGSVPSHRSEKPTLGEDIQFALRWPKKSMGDM